MAEFKLGRIRFVWKGAWATGTAYYKDDVVRFGGKVYLCQIGHTSAADFNTDLDIVPSKWNLMSDGQRWTGDWTTATAYQEGDLVNYGGTVYVCIDGHTSAATAALGLEANSGDWDIFVEGFDWKGDWTVSTRYKLNDIVRYGGINYICQTGHTSAATVALGLEANSSDWQVFSQGQEYLGTWTTSTRYKVNDIVKWGAGLWICTTQHTSSTFPTDSSYWSQYTEGFEFESTWSSATAYQPGDVVIYGGNRYIAKTLNTNSNPLTGTSDWDLFSQGLSYQSTWSNATSYKIGQVVQYGGYNYLAVTDSPSLTFTVTAATASNDRFTIADTTGIVAGMTVRFTGTTFGGINTSGRYYVKTVAAGYITISTTSGGTTFNVTADVAGSMTARVSAEPPNTGYWVDISRGINWRGDWADDTEYNVGDAVRLNSNAYICVQSHRAEGDDGSTLGVEGGGQSNSRPDLDASGTYWNVLTVGSETSVLTTVGDMVYYGGAGPTRLPVGSEGQILRVSAGGIPEWVTWGKVDHVYYVAPSGDNRPYPDCGVSLDKPWASIRYACQQIEKGALNPQAKTLLELNRAFIQKEVSAWIRYQITNNISPFTSSFDYDEYKCERDVGFVVDRLIWDISHGGNLKVRAAAFSLLGAFGESGEFTAPEESQTYVTLASEADEGIAAYNYMEEVIYAVLANEAPTTVYQTLALDSTSIVAQTIDTDYTAETGVTDRVNELVGIITTALTDQVTTNLPSRIVPNNTVFVKTGNYFETLPIIVPAETAIVGDEVRSVHVSPSDSLVHITDAKYTVGSFGRMETVLGQILLGTNVTESTGNTAIQSADFPFASSVEVTALQKLIRATKYKIDWELGTMISASYPNPTNYNTSYLGGYGDARKLLIENKKFIQEEIIAWLAVNYPTLKYGKTDTRQDVGYIVDAMIYDLTYGDSYQSIVTGLAYFDGDLTPLIPASILGATVASQGRLKTVMQQIVANTAVTKTAGNLETQWADSTNLPNGGNASSFIGANMDIIINLVGGDSTSGNPPSINITTIATNNTFTTGSAHGLAVGDTIKPRITANGLVADTVYYVKSVPLSTTFTLAASFDGTTLASFTNGSSLDIDADVMFMPATSWVSAGLVTAWTTLSAASATIASNTVSYINSTYPTLTYNTTKTQRDVQLVLTAIGYDLMFGGNYAALKAAYAYLRRSNSSVYQSQLLKDATIASLLYAKDQAKANVGGNATAQNSIEANMTLIADIIYSGSVEGSICQTEQRSADWARLQLERNRNYIVSEISAWTNDTYKTTVTAVTASTDVFTCADTSWMQRNTAIRFSGTVFGGITAGTTYYVQNIVSSTTFKISTTRNAIAPFEITADASGSMTVSMYYAQTTCERDVGEFIDAFKHDLQFPGSYATQVATKLYTNAVIGNKEENMFLLRNGTGLRNMTLEGLRGDLTPENEYGTSRTTAGAYASLDPGWGPADFRTWIVARSPYVQNVATFGYAAIGQKIDGDLHNGGNKSIVSNDFTQLISDGIGAYVTNNARAELVSVFTYYSHIGYLSENGGRIRGTNGNNSYGDFGSVAEGYDVTETPILAEVDNKAYSVTVGSVLTDGIDEIYQFEYDNAGIDYTRATWSVTGGNSNASVEHTDFRDGAVYQVRLLDNVDDSTAAPEVDGNYGGFGYISNSNTAQGGTTSSITLAATDDEITGAYVGMKVIITSGTGAGQVGIVSAYTSGTKVATVVKESTGGSGWDHIVPGTAIIAPDASSTYIVEPRVSFTGPTYSSTGRTLATAQTYSAENWAVTYGVYTPVSATGGTGSSATFTVVKKGIKYSSVSIVSGGTAYTRLDTLTIAGTSVGGASTANDITITVTAVDSTSGAILAFEFIGVGGGNKFAIVAQSSRNVNTSVDGINWVANTTALPSTSNWRGLASGELTVLETAGGFVTGRAYIITSLGNTVFTSIGASANLVGTYFVATGAGSGTGTATPIANHLVAISSSTTVNAYSTDGGVTWTAGGSLPGGLSGDTVAVAYGKVSGNGRWVAIGANGATAYSTNGGVTWTAGGALPTATNYVDIAYGAGVFVAITGGGSSTDIAAYSTDGGATWSSATLPSSSNWISVTYGANKFVAVSNASGSIAAYSLDGTTWSSSTLSTTGTWTSVKYGQGVFLAVNSANNNGSSSEDGVNWTTRAITRASGTGFGLAAHGNPGQSGIWAIIPSASTTAASSAVLGATAKARAYVSSNKIYAIRITDPGSAYSSAPTITITDTNNLYEAPTEVRIGNGACANVDFINRGTGYDSGIATIDTGDGYANNFQSGSFIAVRRLSGSPEAGANVVFSTQPNTVYKLVQVLSPTGTYDGAKGAFLQISPNMSIYNSPADGTGVTTRIRYSQVRLTGHDFLDIGTGNFTETNYPGEPTQAPVQSNETADLNGGRVFYTSTDQDGNFRVGELFVIEQATGKATLNADAFNIAGLTELSLGNITLGGNSATITEFSTDPFLTANSDTVVPTQKAIKAYIAAQIGGGGASLNVNSIVAGFVSISGTQITTTTGGTIQMKATFNFQAGVRGYPVAWNYFLNN